MEKSTHPVVHFEIGCKDLEKTASFYQKVFGWTPKKVPYWGYEKHIKTGTTKGIQGYLHAANGGFRIQHYVMMYIQVDDIPAFLEKVVAEGGKIIFGPSTFPKRKTIAWFRDPEGNQIGLVVK